MRRSHLCAAESMPTAPLREDVWGGLDDESYEVERSGDAVCRSNLVRFLLRAPFLDVTHKLGCALYSVIESRILSRKIQITPVFRM